MEMKADVLEEAAVLMGLKDKGGLDPEEMMDKDVLGGKDPVNKGVGKVWDLRRARAWRRAEAEVWQKVFPSFFIHPDYIFTADDYVLGDGA